MKYQQAHALSLLYYLRLLVVLHGHGDDIEADDYRDEQVQILAGAHLVDEKPCR